MGAKKGGRKLEDAAEDLQQASLKAILLADSFTTKFRPITLECPKVLLPLVNVRMIDYTLAWLESAEVKEVFVFCCAHSKQITDYLNKSKWVNQPNFSVTPIEFSSCISAGDALRFIYERDVINGDFVLISGDTVSNMGLKQALEEHKERKQKDKNAVMTMVIKQSNPSPITRQTRLGTDELFMVINPATKQLLCYEDKSDNLSASLTLDKAFLAETPAICLHNDRQDCYIDICSEEVLSIFADNFDYQHLRSHFVKGLLDDDITGYKIFTHEIHLDYAARIDNFRSYDSISKDIIQRRTYPFVPDVHFSMNSPATLERNEIYRGIGVSQSFSSKIDMFTYIGKGSSIGSGTLISNSVIGEGCKIGDNVSIEGCYLWNGVTIEDGCKLNHSILCDGVVMKSGSVLDPGVVLSFHVVVGQGFVVPAYSKVSLLPQPMNNHIVHSNEELEYAESSFGTIHDTLEIGNSSSELELSDVGIGGRGFIWSISEDEHDEEWLHSVAPIPETKLTELAQKVYETDIHDDNVFPVADEYDESDDEIRNECGIFEEEIEATFLRGVHEKVKEEHILLELNSLRLSYNMDLEACASALFCCMMKLARGNSPVNLVKNAKDVISRWGKLLKPYLRGIDEEMEVIMKLEEMCLENGNDFAPNFVQILNLLYDEDVVQEEAILKWAQEREGADESDKVFVKQSKEFIRWLNEASEEED